jgi:hypothetical protein
MERLTVMYRLHSIQRSLSGIAIFASTQKILVPTLYSTQPGNQAGLDTISTTTPITRTIPTMQMTKKTPVIEFGLFGIPAYIEELQERS